MDFQVCADICVIVLNDVAVTLPVRAAPPEPDGSWAAAKQGVVRWRDVQTDYTIRPSNEAIRSALRGLRGS